MIRGTLRSARFYSSKPEPAGSMLLSDLLSKIDRITATNSRIKQQQQQQQAEQPDSKPPTKKFGKKTSPKAPKGFQAPSPAVSSQRIRVKNHPLALSSFSLIDSSNSGDKPQRRPRQNADRQQNRGPRQAGGRFERTSRPRPLNNRNNTRKPPTARPVRDQTIESKKLVVSSLQPQITAETFFYGKPVSVITGNPQTGLSSVTKKFLIESNYPYNLPKHIINAVDPAKRGNKYLLQRDWSFKSIDAKSLSSRINEMVKGKSVTNLVDPSAFKGKDALARAVKINAEVMKNGDYTLEQKTLVFNAASGVTSPKDLLAKAHWTN